MTWTTEAAKTTSRKIVLAEIDIGREQSAWVNEGPGIWKATLYWKELDAAYGFEEAFLVGPFEESGDEDLINPGWTSTVTVGSVQEDGAELTERSSYALLYANTGSWYWDEENQIVYVNMTNADYVHDHTMVLGITLKLTNDALANDLGEGYYAERLIGVPKVLKQKDSQVYGLIQHAGGSIEVINNDGALDWIAGADYYGQQVRILHGFEGLSYANYQQILKNYIDDAEFTWETITFSLRDDRQRLSRKLPLNVFDKETYPDLNDDDVGKPIPIFYGQVHNAPVICVNEEESGTPSWTFKVCDTSDHTNGIEEITAVYVDGVAKTPSSSSLANGTFTLSNSDYSGVETVTFDGKGLHDSGDSYIQKALDVLEDILSVYLGITYNSTNYDTTEWAAAEADDLNNNIGIWIDEPTEIIEILELVCNSVKGNFIRKDEDGKYTFRITDPGASSSKTVILNDYQDEPLLYQDTDSLLSVLRVGYNKNQDKDTYSYIKEDSQRTRIFSVYNMDRDLELETALITEADALELAQLMYRLFDEAEPVVDLVLWSKYLDIEIMDVITVPVKRVNGADMIPPMIGEVIGYAKNPLTGLVEVSVRRLKDA